MTKAQRLSSNRITTLPQTIIETVLCFMPTKEAARTSILSREWRYKWTTIPKLEFKWSTVSRKTKNDIDDMTSRRKNMDEMCKLFYAIHQVLLLRQGPIHEFTLSTQAYGTCFEMDQIIHHLSRNHPVKKLTLHFNEDECDHYIPPLCVFSLHHLTDLCLEYCYIKHKPIFNGFSSLTSLSMSDVDIPKDSFLHLLSNCPSLKRLCLLASGYLGVDEVPTLVELFKCLPMIEHLTTSSWYLKFGVDDSNPLELPMPLLHLKYFCFKDIVFSNSNDWTFLSVLIKCSPNLEKLKLETETETETEIESSVLKEYSDLQLMHLNELEVEAYTYLKSSMEFVKFIMVRSPNLKKVILQTWIKDKNKEVEMLNMLLRAPKASQVEIIVDNCFEG